MRFGTFFFRKKNQRRRRFILLLLFFFLVVFVCVVCASGEKEEGGQVGGSVGQKGKAKMGKGRRVFGLLQALPLLPIEAGINTAIQ